MAIPANGLARRRSEGRGDAFFVEELLGVRQGAARRPLAPREVLARGSQIGTPASLGAKRHEQLPLTTRHRLTEYLRAQYEPIERCSGDVAVVFRGGRACVQQLMHTLRGGTLSEIKKLTPQLPGKTKSLTQARQEP